MRPEDEDDDEEHEGPHVLPRRPAELAGDELRGEGLHHAEDQAAEDGALDVADATEHRGRERLEAGEEADPEVDVLVLQPLCDDRVKKFVITEEKRVSLLQRIENMAFDIMNDEKEPRVDSQFCYNCSVKHACEKFKPVMTNGRRKASF